VRTRVREKIDEDSATFWTNDVIDSQINESYRYYWAFILKLHEGYFNKSVNISFDANAAGEYTVSSDFFRARLVSRLLSTEKVPLRYYERYDKAVQKTLGNTTYNFPTYRFNGSKIKFEPAPNFSETDAVEVEITKLLTDLSSSQDVDSEFPPLALDCVVIRAAIKCKQIDEMVSGQGADLSSLERDLLTTEQMLKEVLEQRTVQRQYVEQFGPYENDQ